MAGLAIAGLSPERELDRPHGLLTIAPESCEGCGPEAAAYAAALTALEAAQAELEAAQEDADYFYELLQDCLGEPTPTPTPGGGVTHSIIEN